MEPTRGILYCPVEPARIFPMIEDFTAYLSSSLFVLTEDDSRGRTIAPTIHPYVLPPGTPKDRVEILRRAFMSTMKDQEFLAEASKAKIDINPLDGATLETHVKEVFNLDAALILRLKEILK